MPLVLNGATSGATTLQSTDATTQTITLPANSGTVITTASTFAGTGPAFYATTGNSKSAANSTATEMAGYNAATFDTASCFNTTTGRFTPNVAGYYQFNWTLDFGTNGITTCSVISSTLNKNGAPQWSGGASVSGTSYGSYGASTLLYMNGSTDYVSVYCFQNTGGTVSNFLARFSGALVRAA